MDHVIAIAFAVFIWWFSTGAILYLLRMPSETYGLSVVTASAVAFLGLVGLWVTSDDTTAASAFCGFTCALAVWAWHEISFLTGYVTGVRVTRYVPGDDELPRFIQATQALIYHELAILVTAAAIVWLTWGQPNQVGTATFIILWLARLSAKLNIYLGVPNLTEEFLPPRMSYLKSYFRSRSMNLLFPISVSIATIVTWLCIDAARDPNASAFQVAGHSLLGTLMFLVVIEHWFLVLPLPVAALWNWQSNAESSATLQSSSDQPLAATMPSNDQLQMLARRTYH